MEERRVLNKEMRDDIKRILIILNGNGSPGLIAKVDEHDRRIRWFIGINSFIITTILGTGIVAIMSFIFFKIGIRIPQ